MSISLAKALAKVVIVKADEKIVMLALPASYRVSESRLAAVLDGRDGLLVQQADTRLDETARLLEQGRADDAAASAVRFDKTVETAPVRASQKS